MATPSTAYLTTRMQPGFLKTPRQNGRLLSVSSAFSLVRALVTDDTISMFKLPARAYILDAILSCSLLDSDASPTLELEVGHSKDQDGLFTSNKLGWTGGLSRMSRAVGHGLMSEDEEIIKVFVTEGPAMGESSGTIALTVFYTMAL